MGAPQERYLYSTLCSNEGSVRLVEVLPGTLEEPIKIRIFHASTDKCGHSDRRLSLQQIRGTLPKGWRVRQSCKGIYLFSAGIGEPWQQRHPEKSTETWKYMLAEDHVDGGPHRLLQYDALSYTWGAADKTETALVVSDIDMPGPASTGCRHLPITRNLASALRYLRDGQRRRNLWIDAICINQEDEAEKSIQVRFMGTIYRRASRVVAFLGAPAPGSQLAMSALGYLGAQVTFESTGCRCPAMEAVEENWYRRQVNIGWPDTTWDAVLKLLERPWFSRLWIIQEVQLAGSESIIQCGEDTTSLHLFRRAIHCLRGKDWLPSLVLRSHIESTAALLSRRPFTPLSKTLELSLQRGCRDPRDKVYGILDLVPKVFARRLSLIYTRQPELVYRDMFLAHLRHTRRLELFGLCYQAGRGLPCPSWVPDLSTRLPVRVSCPIQFASGYSRVHFCYEAPNLLALLGVSASVIQEVLDPLELDSSNAVEHIRSWQPPDLMTGTYPTGDSLLHAHAMTLRMNRFKSRPPGQTTALQAWIDGNAGIGLWGTSTEPIPPEGLAEFALAIRRCEGRSYIQTQDGYVGLAPPDTRPGDRIVVLLGCTSPIVLRLELGSGRQRFRLIGECFVLGLGSSHSLLGPLPKPWAVRSYLSSGIQPAQHQQFVNTDTGLRTLDDPRLGPLGAWARLDRQSAQSEARICDHFRNRETGQVMDSDPRLLPGPLLRRGVKLRFFSLI